MTIPVSHHLDLYRYWDAKRGDRLMPVRSDIDPTEIPRLLPSIALIHQKDGLYRWRLMGSRIVHDFGCDLTGQPFGEYVIPERFVHAMAATFDRVLRHGQPVFEATLYTTALRATHAASRLILPLGATVNTPEIILMTRITRRVPVEHEAKFLKGAAGQICESLDISSVQELARRVTMWEEAAGTASVTRISAQPMLRVAGIWGPELPQIIRTGAAKAALVPTI